MMWPSPGPGHASYGAGGGLLHDGDPVSTWLDSSVNGHNATQAGTARPIFKTNIVNGKPVVRFTTAGGKMLNLVPPIPAVHPWSVFMVAKKATTGGVFGGLSFDGASGWPQAPLFNSDSLWYFGSARTKYYFLNASAVDPSGAFHVYSFEVAAGEAAASLYQDGTIFGTSNGAITVSGDFNILGFGDGDIAELIMYSGNVALMAKLVLLLTVLLTTGQMPSQAELELMVGNRARIIRYLHQHGSHPTNAQLDAVVEPMAGSDQANIEKYLGTKYGIAVAGGTAVDPSTVAGMIAWWKADSLG